MLRNVTNDLRLGQIIQKEVFVNTVMILQVQKKVPRFLTSWATTASSRRPLQHEVSYETSWISVGGGKPLCLHVRLYRKIEPYVYFMNTVLPPCRFPIHKQRRMLRNVVPIFQWDLDEWTGWQIANCIGSMAPQICGLASRRTEGCPEHQAALSYQTV